VDESWALWTSGVKASCGSMMAWANTFAADLQTSYLGRSPLHQAVVATFNELQASGRRDNGEHRLQPRLCYSSQPASHPLTYLPNQTPPQAPSARRSTTRRAPTSFAS
jgi:hypothetical protein